MTSSERENYFLSLFNRGVAGLVALGLLIYLLFTLWQWVQPPANAWQAIRSGEYERAIAYLQQDITRGELSSYATLGNLYRFGLGTEQNFTQALQLYDYGARAGDTDAMINLGMMYRLGLGVEPDPEIAYGWFNLAREGRSSVGQQYMSELITNFEVRSNRVSVIRRTFTTIANMPALPTEP